MYKTTNDLFKAGYAIPVYTTARESVWRYFDETITTKEMPCTEFAEFPGGAMPIKRIDGIKQVSL